MCHVNEFNIQKTYSIPIQISSTIPAQHMNDDTHSFETTFVAYQITCTGTQSIVQYQQMRVCHVIKFNISITYQKTFVFILEWVKIHIYTQIFHRIHLILVCLRSATMREHIQCLERRNRYPLIPLGVITQEDQLFAYLLR